MLNNLLSGFIGAILAGFVSVYFSIMIQRRSLARQLISELVKETTNYLGFLEQHRLHKKNCRRMSNELCGRLIAISTQVKILSGLDKCIDESKIISLIDKIRVEADSEDAYNAFILSENELIQQVKNIVSQIDVESNSNIMVPFSWFFFSVIALLTIILKILGN